MNPFDEIAPILAFLLCIRLVISVVWWEWKMSQASKRRRREQAARIDAQRQRWLDKRNAT